MPKVKSLEIPGPSKMPRQSDDSVYIIHVEDVSDPGPFTYLNTIKDSAARFQSLRNIRNKRMASPSSSSHRMESACLHVPEELQDNHGYHRICYRRFTNHLDRIPSSQESVTSPKPSYSRRTSTDQT